MSFQNIFNSHFKESSFFVSGFNHEFRSERKSLDDFYMAEFNFPAEQTFFSLPNLIDYIASCICHDTDYILISDGSKFSNLLCAKLLHHKIHFSLNLFVEKKSFKEIYNKHFEEFKLLDSTFLICVAILAIYSKKPIILTSIKFPIINSFENSNNPPYWVYVENERFHIFDRICKKLNIVVLRNWTKIHPDFYKLYFYSESAKNFSLSDNHTSESINVQIETELCSKEKCITSETNIHLMNYFHENQIKHPFEGLLAQSSFPLHILVRQVGHINQINKFYRDIYGYRDI